MSGATYRRPETGAPRHAGRRPGTRRHGTTVVFLVLVAVACVMLLPFYWMVSSSLRTMENMFALPIQWIPDPVNWRSYVLAWQAQDFGRYFLNSGFVAVAITLSNLLLCSLAGYSLTKFHFRGQQAPPKILKAGDLEVDGERCQVKLAGHDVTLTATEFRLLEFLMTRPGIVFSREQLLDAVWGHDRAVTDRTVDVYILRLRQKIETEEGRSYIRSVRGFGYSFNADALDVARA